MDHEKIEELRERLEDTYRKAIIRTTLELEGVLEEFYPIGSRFQEVYVYLLDEPAKRKKKLKKPIEIPFYVLTGFKFKGSKGVNDIEVQVLYKKLDKLGRPNGPERAASFNQFVHGCYVVKS